MDDAKVTRKSERDDHLINDGSTKANGRCRKRRGLLADHRAGGPSAEDAVALFGSTAVQPTDVEATSSSDLRQLVCSLFVDSIVATVPKKQRQASQKELVALLQRLKIVSSDYFTDTFSSARRPLSALISKFVTQACQQEPTIAFAPNADSALSVNGFSLVNSRYLSDFEEISRIGVGGFGKVFKVRSLIDNQLYAIKQIRFDKTSSESFGKVLSECRYHASLQNEHVVRYHNAWVEFEPPVGPKSVDQQTKRKPLTITRNHSLQSTTAMAWDKDITASHGAGRVFECSADNSNASSATTPDSGSPPPAPKQSGGKFWQSRCASSSLSRSASSDSGEEGTCERQNAHLTASSSSVSVKFDLNADRSSCDEAEKDEEDSVRFASESDEKNTGAMVLWSETQADCRKSDKRRTRIQKSRSSPSFSDLPTVSRRADVDLDFGVPVLYIQMELCSSTLEKYLLERKALNMEFNETTVFGLLSAIDFLHKNQLIHRDVKPSNVLLKRRNGRWCALLGDFGLTREVSQFAHVNPGANDFSAVAAAAGRFGEICRVNMPADSSKLTGGIGTALYAAPEQIVSQDYGPLVDVYSAGIVFYELFQMFKTSMERIVALTKLRENERPTEKFRLIWPEICAVIERMIPIDPDSRWTAAQVLACLCVSKGRQPASDGQNGLSGGLALDDISANGFVGSGPTAVQCESGPLNNSCERADSPLVTTPTNSSSFVDSSLQLEELQQLRRRNAELEAMVEALQMQLADYKQKERNGSELKTDGN